ncbi:ferrous iron transporter FeoB [Sphaerochaeta pleomorpha str. Grapes]|uniref:Ferrous iron transport protein B n=1 Tax=Sphaerochaeta pleomorpha (strain ATCC BAA-1885 / DSM 22778 / Grapes) TaxID=158190 RepID=G8QRU2_SPHPG|nr:ferrous iron transport protein B [Sphaerochaeta pleomorpha]AEV28875.1 ferrous iron transporter FeoB [Sphaerochaeta pleomorpha str. Grapes]
MKTLALVGNPNCGKTTLFNQLTGTTAYVGNWPGVTVEKKEGIWNGNRVLDLPGIYSLSPYSPEEKLTRRYILDEGPDLIIDLIDATNLERSLYLTTQLAELGHPVLLVLNMGDLLEKEGITINTKTLSMMTGCHVVQISASKGEGLEAFSREVEKVLDENKLPALPLFSNSVEKYISQIVSDDFIHNIPIGRPQRWASIKLLEDDELFLSTMPPIPEETAKTLQEARIALQNHYGDDIEAIIIDQRYKVAEKISADCQTRIAQKKKFSFDTIATSKWGAIPLFIAIMAGVFYLSIGLVGGITTSWLESGFDWLGQSLHTFLHMMGVLPLLSGLLIDGIIAGVGSVLTFVPQLFVLFLLLSILEDCGYMARIAFIMDRLMRSIGLSGKSIIPMVIGTGCSVPAIMCTRTIEHQKQRELTVVVTPFIPCGAKMPVFALMITYFFPGRWYIAPLVYFVGILAVIITGLLSQALDKHKEKNAFILELPRYQIPTAKNVWLQTKERIRGFILKAGTVILLSSAIIYLLQSYSFTFQSVEADSSMLALIGKLIAPLFIPLGFGFWQASVALLTGIAAKESIVSTLSVTIGSAGLSSFFTPASALSFMVFILLSSPCIAALSAMAKELGSRKKFFFAILWQTGFAYLAALLSYGLGSLIL